MLTKFLGCKSYQLKLKRKGQIEYEQKIKGKEINAKLILNKLFKESRSTLKHVVVFHTDVSKKKYVVI